MSLAASASQKLHRLSVWQLVLGVVGLSVSLLLSIGVGILILVSKTSSQLADLNIQQLDKSIWLLLFIALLTLPSIFLASRRLSGKPSAPAYVNGKGLLLASGLILVWLGLLWLGSRAEITGLPALLSSLLNICIIALPIMLWLAIGRFNLFSGSKQRVWGIFNFTMLVTTQIIIVVEFILIVIAFFAGAAVIFQQAEFRPFLNLLQQQGQMTNQNIQTFISELLPFISQPRFYGLVALVFCVVIPMLEELFKPLAVWLFAGKNLTISEGWTAGLICGAAFGLFESLSMISIASGDTWISTAIGRVGTGLLHTLTVGLSGYALAKTWGDHKYWRLSAVYLSVILLHGTWNFFALLMGLSQLPVPINSTLLSSLIGTSSWILGGLAILMAGSIYVINQHLRQKSLPPVLPVLTVEPEEQQQDPILFKGI